MKRLSLILFIGLLIILVAGCGSKMAAEKSAPVPENKPAMSKPSGESVNSAEEQLREAKMLYARDKYRQALQHCEKAVELDNRNWEAYYYLGLSMQKLKDYADAIEALQNCLKYSPDNRMVKSEMHASIGYCLENLGKYDEAGQEYDKSLSFNPGNQSARDGQNRIKVEKTLKDWGKDKDGQIEG